MEYKGRDVSQPYPYNSKAQWTASSKQHDTILNPTINYTTLFVSDRYSKTANRAVFAKRLLF